MYQYVLIANLASAGGVDALRRYHAEKSLTSLFIPPLLKLFTQYGLYDCMVFLLNETQCTLTTTQKYYLDSYYYDSDSDDDTIINSGHPLFDAVALGNFPMFILIITKFDADEKTKENYCVESLAILLASNFHGHGKGGHQTNLCDGHLRILDWVLQHHGEKYAALILEKQSNRGIDNETSPQIFSRFLSYCHSAVKLYNIIVSKTRLALAEPMETLMRVRIEELINQASLIEPDLEDFPTCPIALSPLIKPVCIDGHYYDYNSLADCICSNISALETEARNPRLAFFYSHHHRPITTRLLTGTAITLTFAELKACQTPLLIGEKTKEIHAALTRVDDCNTRHHLQNPKVRLGVS